MDGFKSLFQSKTFWGVMISVAGKAAAAFGYSVAPEDEQQIVAAMSLLVSSVGDVYAVYGRVVATKVIGKK